MIILLAPSKTQDFENPLPRGIPPDKDLTVPDMLVDSKKLASKLRRLSVAEICKLMSINKKLGELNRTRYQKFKTPFTIKNARPALLAFTGDVYTGIKASYYTRKDFEFAQKSIRILSGLYGLLRPLDLMQPYRLEMACSLGVGKTKDLYEFWGDRITGTLNVHLDAVNTFFVINLTSQEYYSALQHDNIAARVITPVFKEKQGGKYKTVAIHSKRARGVFTDFIVRNRIRKPEGLKEFREEGYRFNPKLTESEDTPVFTREKGK